MNMSFDFGTTAFVLNVADILSGIAIVIALKAYQATKHYSSVSAQMINVLNKEKLMAAEAIISENLKKLGDCSDAIRKVSLSLYLDGKYAEVHDAFLGLNRICALLLDDGFSTNLKAALQREIKDSISSPMILTFVESNKEKLQELYTVVTK